MDHAPPPPRCFDLTLADGLNLHGAQGGAGPDVVLIHGALALLEDMLIGPYDALAEAHRVTAFDRPGHGRSGRRRLDASIWTQADKLREGAVRLGLERPVLVGHSFGGAVALAWAIQHPDEIAGLVLLAPVAFPEPRLEQLLFGPRALPFGGDLLAQTGGRVMDALAGPLLLRAMFSPQEVPARVLAEFPFDLAMTPRTMQANGEDALQATIDLPIAAMRYAACPVPARILGGTEDRAVNNRLHGQLLARVLPRGAFQALPGLGHMLHHFAQAKVVEAVDEVLAESSRARAA